MGGSVTTAAAPVNQCVILLGGLGTRLGTLTREIPKPLLTVGGKPFVDVLIGEGLRRGFTHFVLLAGYLPDVVIDHVAALRTRLPADCRIDISVELELLGTGGALGHARDLLAERFLLLNGDTWFDFNWLDLVALGVGSAAIAGRQVPLADRYESLEIAPDCRVTRIVQRGESDGPACINGGVYLLHKRHLEGFFGKFSIEGDVLPQLVAQGQLRARVYSGFFLDIGIPESYTSAQTDVPAQQRRPALFLDRDGVLNHDDSYVGSAARLRWIDGAADAVRLANDLGFYVFVVTNQAGVAKGHYCEADVVALHRWMARALHAQGASIDDWRYCLYHPEATVDAYRGAHCWRKPEPGMLNDLMAQWPVDGARSLLVGDQPTDLAAAKAAGVSGFQFTGGNLRDFVEPLLARALDHAHSGINTNDCSA